MKKLTVFLSVLLLSFSFSEDNMINNIDTEKYHKLDTSSVMFSSMKGKKIFMGVGFPRDEYKKTPFKELENPILIGKITISYTQGGEGKSFEVYSAIDEDNAVRRNSTQDAEFEDIIYIPFMDKETNKYIVLEKGQYIANPEIYVSKALPKDLNNVIIVQELDQIK